MDSKKMIEKFKKELDAMTDKEFVAFSKEVGIEVSDRKEGETLFVSDEIILENKINIVVEFSSKIRDILNMTKDKKLIELYKEAIKELAHILLYIHINENVRFRMGALGYIVSNLRELDTKNYDQINEKFIKLLNILTKAYNK